MPWLTIIIALLSFFASKASGASNTKALLTAGLTGAASYYVTHETDWGKANLGSLDGLDVPGTGPEQKDADGNPIVKDGGGLVKKVVDGTFDTLKSWGGTGTAAVIGTTAAASNGLFSSKYIPWLLGLGAIFLLRK